MSNNVLSFPNGYDSPGDPATLDDIYNRVDIIREVFVESASEAVLTCCLQAIGSAGFGQDDSVESAKDAALLQAAIKSLMMRTRGMPHPLQSVADESFEVYEDEDGYVYVEVIKQ